MMTLNQLLTFAVRRRPRLQSIAFLPACDSFRVLRCVRLYAVGFDPAGDFILIKADESFTSLAFALRKYDMRQGAAVRQAVDRRQRNVESSGELSSCK